MKYLLFDIQYNEQFFKQFAGFMYYLYMTIDLKCTLVLPHFRTLPKDSNNMTIRNNENFGYYPWTQFYNVDNLKKKYNVITIDEFSEKNLVIDKLYSKTERFIKGNIIYISNIPIKFKSKDIGMFNQNTFKIFNKNNIIAICGTTNQLPAGNFAYKSIRPNIRYHDYLYKEVENFLKTNNINKYLAVHWRQTDFLIVRNSRNDVLKTEKQLVERCKKLMKEFKIDHIYIATDSKDENKLKYIRDNLPIFNFKSDNEKFYEKYLFAIIESIICAKSTHFYGTRTSLFSVNINGERLAFGNEFKNEYI